MCPVPAGALSLSQAIENIDTLTNLESLFLGKNKITKLQNLDALSNLRVLSMQVPLQLCPPRSARRAAWLPGRAGTHTHLQFSPLGP